MFFYGPAYVSLGKISTGTGKKICILQVLGEMLYTYQSDSFVTDVVQI